MDELTVETLKAYVASKRYCAEYPAENDDDYKKKMLENYHNLN